MVDAVCLTPRLWDGQRLLRFLAGLAMLALAFAAHAGLIGPAARQAATGEAAAVTAPATADAVPVATTAEETATVTEPVPAVALVLVLLVAGSIVAAAGPLGGVRLGEVSGFGTRGPPLR